VLYIDSIRGTWDNCLGKHVTNAAKLDIIILTNGNDVILTKVKSYILVQLDHKVIKVDAM
jgi:hypothetical protein